MKKKIMWIVVAGLILTIGVVAFFSLVYRGPKVLSVSATKSQAESSQGEPFWVKGKVASGSIVREGKVTRFALTDSLSNMNSLYGGTLPDNFSPGVEMEVLGVFQSDGTFEVVKFGKPPAFCSVCHA